ncbi:hypothetical protein AXI59_01155 [Bacillus nakamurai]|uniref:hypothetical protein n=1 Tax=Bacillus nakamurai TaxID=1793963 RepID=UPI0007787EDE|nr:hypothetical protein [Bacillus nakamurai]KXZ17888.1 hypothetical protein AXI59_01155 [Bacillus nakamurai]
MLGMVNYRADDIKMKGLKIEEDAGAVTVSNFKLILNSGQANETVTQMDAVYFSLESEDTLSLYKLMILEGEENKSDFEYYLIKNIEGNEDVGINGVKPERLFWTLLEFYVEPDGNTYGVSFTKSDDFPVSTNEDLKELPKYFQIQIAEGAASNNEYQSGERADEF